MSNLDDRTIAFGSKEQGFVIHFVHVATMASCHFKAFLTAWEDNFKQDWNSYDTVGRMDPIRTFKRTSRVITFGFDIPSADKEEAAHNLNEIQKLIQMSYPTFNQFSTLGKEQAAESKTSSTPVAQKKDADIKKVLDSQKNAGNSVSHMVSPPFLRLKFSNWLNDPSQDPNMSNNDAYNSVHSSKNNSGGSGLYGTIENVKFAPDLSENGGFYGPGDLYNTFNENVSEKILIPKLLKLDITFNVLHTNDLGFYASSGEARTPSFPYNANRILNRIRVK